MILIKVSNNSHLFSARPRSVKKVGEFQGDHCPVCSEPVRKIKSGTQLETNDLAPALVLKDFYVCPTDGLFIAGREKKRPGRKKLPRGEKRNHTFTARLTDAELDSIDRRRGDVRVGEWIRTAALSTGRMQSQKVPEVNVQTALELRRIGTNLNQLARQANSEGLDTTTFRAAVDQVHDLMRELKGLTEIDEGGDTDES